MIKQNTELLREIKNKMYNSRTLILNQNKEHKFISFYDLYNHFKPEQDWYEVAEKCSNNKNHEFYGKPPEEILSLWEERKTKGKVRGNKVDDYIKALMTETEYILVDDTDELFKQKMVQIKDFYDNVLHNLVESYIGDEIWLISPSLGVRVRCDMLFVSKNGKILIGEWKNIENYKTYNKYSKLKGALLGYDDCDLFSNNLQVYLYKYILEEHGYDTIPFIVNFQGTNHTPIKTVLDNNYKTLLPKMVSEYRENI